MLAGRLERRDVPHAEGQWVEFKTLSGLQMQTAEDRKTERDTKAYAATVSAFDAQTLASLRTQGKKPASDPEYDSETLIKWAINDWSLESPCTDENKLLLDGPTLEWAISVILEMNTRPLAKSVESGTSLPGENSHQNSEALTVSSSTE